jgi:hypothetical protein
MSESNAQILSENDLDYEQDLDPDDKSLSNAFN